MTEQEYLNRIENNNLNSSGKTKPFDAYRNAASKYSYSVSDAFWAYLGFPPEAKAKYAEIQSDLIIPQSDGDKKCDGDATLDSKDLRELTKGVARLCKFAWPFIMAELSSALPIPGSDLGHAAFDQEGVCQEGTHSLTYQQLMNDDMQKLALVSAALGGLFIGCPFETAISFMLGKGDRTVIDCCGCLAYVGIMAVIASQLTTWAAMGDQCEALGYIASNGYISESCVKSEIRNGLHLTTAGVTVGTAAVTAAIIGIWKYLATDPREDDSGNNNGT